MIQTNDITRPPREWVEALQQIGAATVSSTPGDIIVADDDGTVVVPVKLAPERIEQASVHHEWRSSPRAD